MESEVRKIGKLQRFTQLGSSITEYFQLDVNRKTDTLDRKEFRADLSLFIRAAFEFHLSQFESQFGVVSSSMRSSRISSNR